MWRRGPGVGGGGASVRGRCDFLGESSACSASPRGRHSFLHLAGELLLRGYRLGEDRGSTGWGVAHKSSLGGGDEGRMPVIPMQGRSRSPELIDIQAGAVGQAEESNYAKGAVTFMKYANPQQAWPK